MPNWKDVLERMQRDQNAAVAAAQATVDTVRRDYLKQLHNKTGRNVIAYYSGWLSKTDVRDVDINDEDKNGFMMAVHMLDKSKGLDLILHTPGGDIAATESIVNYLRQIFRKDIRTVVPQIAMSAGTMIACSSKAILMSRHSNLGPIDPHLGRFPAYGVIAEFKRALDEIKKDNTALAVWQPILAQYRPTFLAQCENAIKWSNKFVRQQLAAVMFEGDPKRTAKAARIVTKLTDFSANKSHSRHIHFEECKQIGLKVELIEDDQELQDLVLTVHHCFMHSITNTPTYKIIENHNGNAFMKQQRIIPVPVPRGN
jgi:ATP-dependent protease ClpP protease subunit